MSFRERPWTLRRSTSLIGAAPESSPRSQERQSASDLVGAHLTIAGLHLRRVCASMRQRTRPDCYCSEPKLARQSCGGSDLWRRDGRFRPAERAAQVSLE